MEVLDCLSKLDKKAKDTIQIQEEEKEEGKGPNLDTIPAGNPRPDKSYNCKNFFSYIEPFYKPSHCLFLNKKGIIFFGNMDKKVDRPNGWAMIVGKRNKQSCLLENEWDTKMSTERPTRTNEFSLDHSIRRYNFAIPKKIYIDEIDKFPDLYKEFLEFIDPMRRYLKKFPDLQEVCIRMNGDPKVFYNDVCDLYRSKK